MIAEAPPQLHADLYCETNDGHLTALIVSSDRPLHRLVNHYLEEAGYRTVHTSSVEQALALIESTECNFLLVDADLQSGDALELCREAGTSHRGSCLAKLLLQSSTTGVELADLLHAGVDDVLLKPLSYLELLARLRAAARTFEFRRRVAAQLGLDPTTHLPNEPSFRRQAQQLLARSAPQVSSCLLLSIDHFRQKTISQGTKATDEFLLSVAELLGREQLENEYISHWGNGTFSLLCKGQGATESLTRANELSQALCAALTDHNDDWVLSLSIGVADSSELHSAQEMIEQAEQAMQRAQLSGGDCVCHAEENNQDSTEQRELEGTGKLFQSTFAADLMTPCVLTFSDNHGIWHAACLLRRHRLEASPVIDSNGKCVGIIESSNLPQTPEEAANRSVSAFRAANAEMCGEETVLGDIMQRLSEKDTQWLVITRHGRPTGMISRDQLAAFGQPLTVESLRNNLTTQPYIRLEELLVPEHCA